MLFERVFCLKLIYQISQVNCPDLREVLEQTEMKERSGGKSLEHGASSKEIFQGKYFVY